MALDYKMESNACFEERKLSWTIKNFSKLPDLVQSPQIFPVSGYAIIWEFWMEFKVENGYYYMLLGIKNVSGKNFIDIPIKAVGHFCYKASDGSVIGANKTFEVKVNKSDVVNISKLHYGNQLPTHVTTVFPAIKDDIFIIEFCMTVSGIVTSAIFPISVLTVSDSGNDSSEILKLMYKKGAFYDFTIHIGEEKIHTHKLILSARSPVFDKLLEHETLEKMTNSVTLEDTSFEVFNSFIKYLYTWQIDEKIANDFEMLLELYEVSDKYQVKDLQDRCTQILIHAFLNTENVCKLLEVADMHGDNGFKEIIIKFFRHKFSEVTITSEWKLFLKRNVHLAAEVISDVTSLLNLNKS